MHNVPLFLLQIAPEQGVPMLDQPSEIKRKSEEESRDLVHKANTTQVIIGLSLLAEEL